MFSRRIISNVARASRAQGVAKIMTPQMGLFAMQTPKMNFSAFETIEKASQKLTKSLDSEIKYENENYTQLEDIETFLNESGFMFKETDNGLEMTLTKEVGDKKVTVVFEAR